MLTVQPICAWTFKYDKLFENNLNSRQYYPILQMGKLRCRIYVTSHNLKTWSSQDLITGFYLTKPIHYPGLGLKKRENRMRAKVCIWYDVAFLHSSGPHSTQLKKQDQTAHKIPSSLFLWWIWAYCLSRKSYQVIQLLGASISYSAEHPLYLPAEIPCMWKFINY